MCPTIFAPFFFNHQKVNKINSNSSEKHFWGDDDQQVLFEFLEIKFQQNLIQNRYTNFLEDRNFVNLSMATTSKLQFIKQMEKVSVFGKNFPLAKCNQNLSTRLRCSTLHRLSPKITYFGSEDLKRGILENLRIISLTHYITFSLLRIFEKAIK